jgi:hypothetical protein
MAKKGKRRGPSPSKQWNVYIPGQQKQDQISADILTVSDGALVFSLQDGTVTWVIPAGGWTRVQSASYPDG